MNAAAPTVPELERIVGETLDPETARPLAKEGQVDQVRLEGDRVLLRLLMSTHSSPLRKVFAADLTERLQNRFPSIKGVDVEILPYDRKPVPLGQLGVRAKSVIAVGSGKGGVGKSTIAASLAYGMVRAGCKVGLVDADVYGPSVPQLVGVSQRPEIFERPGPGGALVKRIMPIDANGLLVMSMGLLLDPEQAVVWRGPMLHGAIQQFLRDTEWGDLDYLFIDLPPGTGDIALSLSQMLPLTGSVVVCTPQDVALLDAVRAVSMFRQVKIPILGMVENMSYFICPDNGKRYEIFGSGGAKKRAGELNVPFLGEVPLNIGIRVRGDEGRIFGVFDDPESGPFLDALCLNLAKNVAERVRQAPRPSLPVL